jgi:hypothetical protein
MNIGIYWGRKVSNSVTTIFDRWKISKKANV